MKISGNNKAGFRLQALGFRLGEREQGEKRKAQSGKSGNKGQGLRGVADTRGCSCDTGLGGGAAAGPAALLGESQIKVQSI
jgi:hypothetical protein